ncbi:MAG: FG-GAP repeat domain-containing protein, partial [Planctomycetota bacterium]
MALLAGTLASTGCSVGIALAIIELTKTTPGTTTTPVNQAPSVQVQAITRTDGQVELKITAFDKDDPTVNINVTYNVGAGALGATLSQTVIPADEFGSVETSVFWNAPLDLGSTAYVSPVNLQISCDDGKASGPIVFPAAFAFGNDAPVVTSVVVDTDVSNQVAGITAIRFTITDSTPDLCDVTAIEISAAGDFSDAVDIPLNTGVNENFPTGSLTGLTANGTEHSVSWDTELIANYNASGVKVRLKVQDSPSGSTTPIESAFVESNAFDMANLDQNEPFAALSGVKRADAGGLRTGAIFIDFTLFDPESDPCDVRVEYSTDEKATWNRCTEYASYDSEGHYDLASSEDGIKHRFMWDAAADLFILFPVVHIRVIPAATDGIGPPAETFIEISVGQDAFDPAQVANLQSRCNACATGDLNGDNLVDVVVVASAPANFMYVLLNNGTTMIKQPDISVPGGSQDVVIGTFNGDAFPDVAICSPLSNSVTVLLGTGGGAFGSPTPFPCGGTTPRRLVAGRFDADGFTDLVVSNASNTIAFLKGLGTGAFSPPLTTAVSGAPAGLAVLDFNADSRLDLAVCLQASAKVRLLSGNNDGTFTIFQDVDTSNGPFSVAVADLDLDGHVDVAVGSGSNNVDVSLFDPVGNAFLAAAQIDIGAPAQHLVAGDFNADTRPDLCAMRYTNNDVMFLLSSTTGPPSKIAYPAGINGPFYCATGDFNRDGQLDLAIVSDLTAGNNFSVLVSAAEGKAAPANAIAVGMAPSTVLLVDLNRDGALDIITVHAGDQSIEIRLGGGNGRFEYLDTVDVGLGNPHAMCAGDFNSDGFMDLAVANLDNNEIRILSGDGSGLLFVEDTFFSGPGGAPFEEITCMACADINGDTILDLIVGNRSAFSVSTLTGNGDGTFNTATMVALNGASPRPWDLALGDFNNDGEIDVAVVCTSTNDVHMLFNSGGALTEAGAAQTVVAFPEGIVAGHFGPDDDLDLAVACSQGVGKITLLTNTGAGDGTFTRVDIDAVPGPTDIVTGDYNRDGILDLAVCGNGTNVVAAFAGQPDGTYRPAVSTPIPAGPVTLATGDVDNDGAMDLAVACMTQNQVATLLGRRTRARWSRNVFAFNESNLKGQLVGASTIPTGLDHFGSPRAFSVGQRNFHGTGDDGVDNQLTGSPVQV